MSAGGEAATRTATARPRAMTEFETYTRGWRRRWERQRQADVESARRARQIADRLARRLAEEFGARRVVLTGSLACGEFRAGSDIDLAAEGIPDELFFRAGAVIEAAAEGYRVDLVPIESAGPEYLDDLAREGVELDAEPAA